MNSNHNGILYVVATPIGNLEDITIRALKILKEVDFIICEDTRTASKLLARYEIEKKTYSYYSPKEARQAKKYLDMLEEGKSAALISENGTPGVSDPGIEIVKRAYERNIKVIPAPGPSAVTTAVSVSGIPAKNMFFAGFIPRKKGERKRLLENHLGKKYAFIFYDSKYRLKDTLGFIREIAPETEVFVGREMTKKFEEYIKGNIIEVEKKIVAISNLRGEFVVLCSGLKK